jgi:hypothetical protein
LVLVVQEVQRFFAPARRPSPATVAVATPTPRRTTQPVQVTSPKATASPPTLSSATSQAPAKPVNFSGKWVGSFSETIEGNVYQYRYTLELSQQGAAISGRSTIEKEDDPGTFARFLVRGQVLQNAEVPAVKIAEDLFGAQNLHAGGAAAPRTTELSYFLSQDLEYLEGEWVDRRASSGGVSGTVKLTRQP